MKHSRSMLCWALAIGIAVNGLLPSLALAEAAVPGAAALEAVLDAELLTPGQRFAFLDEGDPILFPALKPAVVLTMADDFGRPAFSGILPSEGAGSSSGGGMPLRPSLRPGLPNIPTPNPLQLLAPKKQEKVKAGSKYTLSWTLDSGRRAAFDLLLSIDDGKTYDYIAKGVTEKKYKWDVPNAPSTKCRLRIEAYVGSAKLAELTSDAFTIVKAATPTPKKTATPAPTPTPTPTPVPTPTPAPNEIINPAAFYRKDGSFFINKAQGGLRWFRVEVLKDAAARIVWQISKVPFIADNGQALSPPGLIAAGELAPGQREFAVDFDALVGRLTGSLREGCGWGELFTIPQSQVLLNQTQYNFYIRAIALDAAGNLLGDADGGLSAGYGTLLARPALAEHAANAVLVQAWVQETASQHYGVSSEAFMHRPEGIYAHPDDPLWRFEFRDRPANAVAQELQIATAPFAGGAEPQGLVFRERVDYTEVFPYAWPMKYMLEFAKFVPPADTLGISTVTYYVRMVFFVQDQSDPGRQYAVPSEAQIIFYNNLELNEAASKLQFAPTRRVAVRSYVPYTSLQYYMPVQWEHPNVEEYFQVSRRIMAQENMITVKKDGQVVLYPYPLRQMMGDHTSVEEYQQRLDTYLPIGTVVHISPKDPSLWDEAVGLLKSIYNGVRNGYDDLKSTVVGFVADNFPFLGDDAREALHKALEIALNAGLAAIGIPPSLPDFEKLASEGFEYCLAVALEEACKQMGIPENEITEEIRQQVAGEFSKKLASLNQSANASPLSYLQPSSLHCYRPAYFVVFVQNFSDQPSPAGTLVADYRVLYHFLHFYETARLPIPSLAPGEHLQIKCYWAPKIAKPVADYKPGYDKYYFGNGIYPCEFSVSVTYDVPDAQTLALEQGLFQKPGFPLMNYEYVYDHDPVYAFSFQAPPCDYHAGDTSVDIMDFYE